MRDNFDRKSTEVENSTIRIGVAANGSCSQENRATPESQISEPTTNNIPPITGQQMFRVSVCQACSLLPGAVAGDQR